MLDVNIFEELRIGLADADDMRAWSHGEVKKPETINYRTLKPEKDGLFCEKIFGPTRDWECNCGKYKRVRFKGIICERCGVEVTRSKVRRDRMGHVELAAPVTHIWFFKGMPSRLGYLLDLAPKDLEKVIYFAAYMVTHVDEEMRHEDLPQLQDEIDLEKKQIGDQRDLDIAERLQKLETDLAELETSGAKADAKRKVKDGAEREMANIRSKADKEIEQLEEVWDRFKNLKPGDLEGDEQMYRSLQKRYGDYFEAQMGAEAIQKRLKTFDLAKEAELLREIIDTGKGQRKARALKRLKVVNAFLTTDNKPESMVLEVVPVIPPDLRPMVQLDGGRFATSDLNDLYRRVINRNNRLKRLLDLGAPEIIVNNEKRMLQEAVDALFDNGRRGRPVTGPGNRPLKSISDMLKGKQGRFRQNLLGKRVDYSGRSVIVVGPTLKLHQCGLPKDMALELFKPFVMKRLVELNHAQNIKSAKRMVERGRPVVWDVLEEVITEHPVLLNRAPTLHRLGIQAFEPQLVEGKAIHLHPLVCAAFNADFDGDQMAVHLPLSAEAQAEARILMLSSNNILKPSDGRPVTMPSQDMIIGLHHLTWMPDVNTEAGQKQAEELKGYGRMFGSQPEAIMAFDRGELDLNAPVKIFLDELAFNREDVPTGAKIVAEDPDRGVVVVEPMVYETTLGRTLFNETLPIDYPYQNRTVGKNQLSEIVNELAESYPKVEVGASLDALKDAGYKWATRSGVTIGIADVAMPPEKAAIMAEHEERAQKVQDQFDMGLITDEERRQELIEIWTEATDAVAGAMRANLEQNSRNTLFRMVDSGARGNWMQVRQIAGMRGLVANPKGEIIPRPIKSNYREGLSVLEYFIASHGARKGLADTALRTADSGYLTRRLVDVSQDVIIREIDCGTNRGLDLPVAELVGDVLVPHPRIETSIYARTLASDVMDADGNVIAHAGDDLGDHMIHHLHDAGIEHVKVRSVLTCQSRVGTCALCYGRSLATGKLVDIGEAVGIIAAQSIGEPGTQLTMRTFHTGGVVGAQDVTQGLPRVTELFEARTPKGEAPIAEYTGTISIEEGERTRTITLTPANADIEEQKYLVPKYARLTPGVEDGAEVTVGTQFTQGAADPKKVLRIMGPRKAQQFLVDQVQETYRSQGVEIHDKHIEVIVRQMLRRITVLDSGDTTLLPGELAERVRFEDANRAAVAAGGKPATGRPELIGITKASLATESWLSAASFQETTRVLTEAATSGRRDSLLGLKENVIIGKLIPAGTGLPVYREIEVEPTEQAKAELYPSFGYDEIDFPTLGFGSGDAIPLDDLDFSEFR